MTTARKLEQADLVNYAIGLLASGSPEEWNCNYRARDFNRVIPEKSGDAVCLDFEYSRRHVLYTCVQQRFIGREPIDYLEFGVAAGDSFRDWLKINALPESRFYGFDSFEGLPEDWQIDSPKGAYSQDGNIPEIDDPRATIIDGLFQHSLPGFLEGFRPANRLVVHMDADLYSSTLYCLTQLDRHIAPGTIILFDEFSARSFTDEFAALQDYCTACYRDYRVIAMRRDFVKVAVEVTR